MTAKNTNSTAEVKPDAETLTVELTPQDWEAILQVIELSNAPHFQVKSIQTELLKQLRK